MALALLPDKSYEWIKCISNLILTNGLQDHVQNKNKCKL